MVAAKLHNFVIDQGLGEIVVEPLQGDEDGLGYIPTAQVNEETEDAEDDFPTAGTSIRRQTLLHFIRSNGLARPEHNVARNG